MQTKKLLAILIAAVMVFALLPASVFAEDITLIVGVGGYTTIQDAINDVKADSRTGTWTIRVKAGTYNEDVGILQQDGKNIRLIGVTGAKVTGGITVDGDGRVSGTETVLIKNIVFDKSGETLTAAEDLIALKKLSSSTIAYGYTHNVTIEDCSFIGDLSGVYTVGIRAGDSGGNTAYNTTIKNCSFKNLHSAVQAYCHGLTINGCTTENMAEGGVNTQNSTEISILNSQISGGQYGLRVGQNNGTENVGTVTIRNSRISGGLGADGEGAIFIRGTIMAALDIDDSDIIGQIVSTSPNASLNVKNVFLSGTITGIAPENIIITDARGSITEVTSGVDPTYIITIPSKVEFGKLARDTGPKEKTFTVGAIGVVIEQGVSIHVKVNSEFKMKCGSATIPYTLYSAAGKEVLSDGVFATFAASLLDQSSVGKVKVDTTNILYAGDYSDIMTFTIDVASGG